MKEVRLPVRLVRAHNADNRVEILDEDGDVIGRVGLTDKAQELAGKAQDTAEDAQEGAEGAAEDAQEGAEGAAEDVEDKAEDAKDGVETYLPDLDVLNPVSSYHAFRDNISCH